MALTHSKMLSLGTSAPDFKLRDSITLQDHALEDVRGDKATVIMFICNHCPYVKHIQPEIVRLAKDYENDGVGFVAINSNDIDQYPEDSPERMKEVAMKWHYSFPYLFDSTQEVAHAYDAACTPDFYIFDKDLKLAYRGQLDDSRPGNEKPLTGKDIRKALDDMLNGNPVDEEQVPSQGCSIKWK